MQWFKRETTGFQASNGSTGAWLCDHEGRSIFLIQGDFRLLFHGDLV
jgi:hypothetical protein